MAADRREAQQRRRPLWRSALLGVAAGLAVAFLGEAVRVLVLGNFHAVIPGRVYRCAQPSPAQLEALVKSHGIRTVINLRGSCPNFDWYRNQCRVAHCFDVAHEDVCLSAGRMPSTVELRRLVEVLDHCEYPVVLHCHRGADRTGLTAALIRLLQTDDTLATARRQLGIRYGHLSVGRPTRLQEFFDLYERWLQRRGTPHRPALLRAWLADDYCPGTCRCEMTLLEAPATLTVGKSTALRVRVRNTSDAVWRFSPHSRAGVHLTHVLYDDRGRARSLGRSGMFDAVLEPGGSMDLTVAVAPPRQPGRHLLVIDMGDEQHCCFFQVGSEPLELEFEAREQEVEAGGRRADPGRGRLEDGLVPGR